MSKHLVLIEVDDERAAENMHCPIWQAGYRKIENLLREETPLIRDFIMHPTDEQIENHRKESHGTTTG